MLKDSQLKVTLLRMKISSLETSGSPEPGEASQGREGGTQWPGLRVHLLPAGPDLLAEELQHRLRIEAAVAAGAKNVVKLLGGQKMQDRKALAEVRLCPLAYCSSYSSASLCLPCSAAWHQGLAACVGCRWRSIRHNLSPSHHTSCLSLPVSPL